MGDIYHAGQHIGGCNPIDDSSTSLDTLWSSEKIDTTKQDKIKTGTFSGIETSGNGNTNSAIVSNTPRKIVLSATVTDGTYTYLGMPYLSNDGWNLHVITLTSATEGLANKTISGTYWYEEY